MDSRTGENQERSKYDSAIDLFSLLHEDLVLDILSYLPPRDVARSSVLSKSWHHVWNSIPTENFHFFYDGRRDSNAINNFINSVDDSLQEFRGRQITKIKSFSLCLPIPYAEEFPCLDDWIGLVTHHCIEELQICIDFAMIKFPRAIFQAKSLSVLRLQGFTMRGTVLGGDITLPCLKILSLSGVYNSDLMTEKFLSSCPSLEQFSILASDLKNLHISNLPKLKKVEAEVSHKIHIEGLNIQILRCTIFRSSGLELEELHCNNLKELSVHADITNYWIQQLFEKFHLLEILHLKSFQLCQRVFISSHKLKRLSLDLNTRPEVLDINAPNLKSLTYRGETLPCLCRMNTSSPQIAKMGIDATKEFIGRAWFLRLKNYLGVFHNHELLALSVYSNEVIYQNIMLFSFFFFLCFCKWLAFLSVFALMDFNG